jgi:hypothetical protein
LPNTRTGRPVGRPLKKFTPEACAQFIQAASLGLPRRLCAQAAGWSESVAYEYLARAHVTRQRQHDGDHLTPTDQRFVRFGEEVEKAEAVHAQSCMAVVINAARQGTWQAGAWALERRWPDLFGRRFVEVTGEGGGPIRVEVSADDLLARLQGLNGRGGVVDAEVVEDPGASGPPALPPGPTGPPPPPRRNGRSRDTGGNGSAA